MSPSINLPKRNPPEKKLHYSIARLLNLLHPSTLSHGINPMKRFAIQVEGTNSSILRESSSASFWLFGNVYLLITWQTAKLLYLTTRSLWKWYTCPLPNVHLPKCRSDFLIRNLIHPNHSHPSPPRSTKGSSASKKTKDLKGLSSNHHFTRVYHCAADYNIAIP